MSQDFPNRRSIRLKYFDYASEYAYFVTICTYGRMNLFGQIMDGTMVVNDFGGIVETTWHDLPNHIAGIELDEFVIMPDHFHGIISIVVGAGSKPARIMPHKPARIMPHKPARIIPMDANIRAGLEPMDANIRAGLEPMDTNIRAGLEPMDTNIRAGLEPAPTGTPLSEIVRQLKTFSARRINKMRGSSSPVWQRNFYEHIIRNENDLNHIREYIIHNPQQRDSV